MMSRTLPLPRFANHTAYQLKNFLAAELVFQASPFQGVSILFKDVPGNPLVMQYHPMDGQNNALLELNFDNKVGYATTLETTWAWIFKTISGSRPDIFARGFLHPHAKGVLGKNVQRSDAIAQSPILEKEAYCADFYMFDRLQQDLHLNHTSEDLFHLHGSGGISFRIVRNRIPSDLYDKYEVRMVAPTRMQISLCNQTSGGKCLVYNTLQPKSPDDILEDIAHFWPAAEKKAANSG